MKTRLACFTVSGYRNFGDPITIDFTDVHDYKFSQECIDDGIIMKMGVYGPNGSGKSNLGFALFNIVQHLTDKEAGLLSANPNIFLNADSGAGEAVFRYEFIIDGSNALLEYCRTAASVIAWEKFTINGSVIYDYDYQEHHFRTCNLEDLAGNNLNFEYMGDNLSVLRYIANNSVQKENSPIRAIMDFTTHMLWFRSVSGNNYIGFETGVTSLEEWIIGKGYVKDFNAFLNDICGMSVNLGIAKGADGKQMLVEKHANGPLIFWQVRSSGTSAAELFYFWMKRFDEVSFLFLDEYDAFYHFELAGRIIDKLKTYKDLQVIFTTHNTSLMGNSILRPDCYMLLADGKLRSYIDRAGGREIREGHNLEKIYRNGGLND